MRSFAAKIGRAFLLILSTEGRGVRPRSAHSEPQGPKGLKEAGLFCGSCLRKDEMFAYGGSFQNMKELNDPTHVSFWCLRYPWLELLQALPFDAIISHGNANLGPGVHVSSIL